MKLFFLFGCKPKSKHPSSYKKRRRRRHDDDDDDDMIGTYVCCDNQSTVSTIDVKLASPEKSISKKDVDDKPVSETDSSRSLGEIEYYAFGFHP